MNINLRIGIAVIAFCTLVLELSLIRVFDVILNPSMGYAIITCSVFALGLGGIYLYLFHIDKQRTTKILPWLYIAFAISVLVMLPVTNFLPFDLNFFDFNHSGKALYIQLISWIIMYIFLITPFFIAGLIISLMLTHYSEQIHTLYFFDLIGAGLGCVIVIPLITPIGPGGIQWWAAGFAFLGSLLFMKDKLYRMVIVILAGFLLIYPVVSDNYLEFTGHSNKRGVDDWTKNGLRDHFKWDPVSKVEVFKSHPGALNFAMDGGQQGSWLQQFNGDFTGLRQQIADDDNYYFGLNSVSHYFKRGTKPKVLVIGAAVGGETRAAVAFESEKVDAIELVGEMVKAAKGKYGEYSGQVFNHPTVDYRVGEGRTFLRSSDEKFDIIQMFSNHSSSSIADGTGAIAAAYLQTKQAYKEYFTHLSDDGMMQINHHIYPRMLVTAAQAWQELGKKDFSKHVLVIERWVPDTLPTMLIKNQPWQQHEIADVIDYMNRERFRFIMPWNAKPSKKILQSQHYEFQLPINTDDFQQFSIWFATYLQDSIDYDLDLTISDQAGEILLETTVPADKIHDNFYAIIKFKAIENRKDENLTFKFSSANTDPKKGVSVWLINDLPIFYTQGEPRSYVVAFDPLNPDNNIIPQSILNEPFDESMIEAVDYDLSPVSDDNPYFGMIRRQSGIISAEFSPMMDKGTEQFLNLQVRPFLSMDWLNLFIVGTIATVFSLVFIFVPIFFSRHGRARWPKMGSYLTYFACLGSGFIMIELVLIQIFKKLIGYPTHTFATVIFALLIAAGLGSYASKSLNIEQKNRWKIVFVLIFAFGLLFLFTHQAVFNYFLAKPLMIRILAAVAMLAPLGFVLGMPLPMAINMLGKTETKGIPWAWGMNGFFTTLGGFLSIILSYLFGFQMVLLIGLLIYLIAFFMYRHFNISN